MIYRNLTESEKLKLVIAVVLMILAIVGTAVSIISTLKFG